MQADDRIGQGINKCMPILYFKLTTKRKGDDKQDSQKKDLDRINHPFLFEKLSKLLRKVKCACLFIFERLTCIAIWYMVAANRNSFLTETQCCFCLASEEYF